MMCCIENINRKNIEIHKYSRKTKGSNLTVGGVSKTAALKTVEASIVGNSNL